MCLPKTDEEYTTSSAYTNSLLDLNFWKKLHQLFSLEHTGKYII